MKHDPKNDPVVAAFSKEVRRRMGVHLRQLRLFGSRARGDAKKESDYDMLVIVDHRTPEIRSIILDIEVSMLDQYEAFVSSVLRDEHEWQLAQDFPLAQNINREGVSL